MTIRAELRRALVLWLYPERRVMLRDLRLAEHTSEAEVLASLVVLLRQWNLESTEALRERLLGFRRLPEGMKASFIPLSAAVEKNQRRLIRGMEDVIQRLEQTVRG